MLIMHLPVSMFSLWQGRSAGMGWEFWYPPQKSQLPPSHQKKWLVKTYKDVKNIKNSPAHKGGYVNQIHTLIETKGSCKLCVDAGGEDLGHWKNLLEIRFAKETTCLLFSMPDFPQFIITFICCVKQMKQELGVMAVPLGLCEIVPLQWAVGPFVAGKLGSLQIYLDLLSLIGSLCQVFRLDCLAPLLLFNSRTPTLGQFVF